MMIDDVRGHVQVSGIQCPLNRARCRGHVKTLLISFGKRALFENIGKYQHFKCIKCRFFFIKKIVYSLTNHILKLKLDLMVSVIDHLK